MFKPGDFVRFIHAKEEGRIIRSLGTNEWEIETTDGFRIPVVTSELVKVHAPETEVVKEPMHRKTTGRQLAVVPFNDQAFDLYWINDSASHCLFSLYETDKKNESYKGVAYGILEPYRFQSIARLSWKQLQEDFYGIAQYCSFAAAPSSPEAPSEFRFKISGLQVLRSSQTVPLLEQKGYLFSIEVARSSKSPNPLPVSSTSGEEQVVIGNAKQEVDLHIQKLLADHENMNAADIMKLQLDTFEKELDLAVAHNQSQIIFIHGIGNGILKNELHRRLGKHPHVASFSDARKEKFGYGATLVQLK